MSVFFLFCCPVKSKYLCFTEYDYIYSNALLHCLKRWLKWLNCSENAAFVFVSYFFFDHLTFAMPALVFTKLPLYKLCYRDSCLIVCLSTDRSVKKVWSTLQNHVEVHFPAYSDSFAISHILSNFICRNFTEHSEDFLCLFAYSISIIHFFVKNYYSSCIWQNSDIYI